MAKRLTSCPPDRLIKALKANGWRETRQSGSHKLFERNPFFWKVDGEGNQLPYIDQVLSQIVDAETYNLRIIARGLSTERRVPDSLAVNTRAVAARGGERGVYFGSGLRRIETPVVDRSDIGDVARGGPLIVEEYDSTTVVPPGCTVRRVGWDTLMIEVGPEPV